MAKTSMKIKQQRTPKFRRVLSDQIGRAHV